jgi:DNA modification methylase
MGMARTGSDETGIRDRIVELRRVHANDLRTNPRNWRRHPEAQTSALRGILAEVGYADALLARETPDGLELIDGHLRASTTPDALVPVLILDVTEEEADLILASLDPLAAMAQVDQAALAALLDRISIPEKHLAAELTKLAGAVVQQGLTDPDAIPDVPAEPRTRPGDLWVLGEHRLLCGDSRNPEDVARLLDGASLDLIVTSPPYNVGIDYDSYDDAEVDRDSYLAFLRSVLDVWVEALGQGRMLAWNLGVSAKTHHLHQGILLEAVGLSFQRQLVWVKTGVPLPTYQHTRAASRARRYSPNYRHELIYLASKGEPEEGGPIGLPGEGESDVWEHFHQFEATKDLPEGSSERRTRRRNSGLARHAVKAHPAAFPVKLPETLIGYLTAPGEVVADPFAGSGSTLIAAQATGRRGIGMELDPAYVDVAVARWEAFTGQEGVLHRG